MRLVFKREGQGMARTAVLEKEDRARTLTAPPGLIPLTSGLFRVPQAPNLTLHMYALNSGDQPAPVMLQLNHLTGDERVSGKEEVISHDLTIGPMEAAVISTDIVGGQVLEVNATIPNILERVKDAGVAISASVVQFFPADGATTPQITFGAGSFVTPVGTTEPWVPDLPPAPHGTITSGFLDMAQGVAASRPQTRIMVSSFASIPLRAMLVVRELVEHQPIPQVIEEHNIRVPAGGAAIVPLESVEGRTVEVMAKVPRELVVSLESYFLFLADETTMPIFRLGPRDWSVVR